MKIKYNGQIKSERLYFYSRCMISKEIHLLQFFPRRASTTHSHSFEFSLSFGQHQVQKHVSNILNSKTLLLRPARHFFDILFSFWSFGRCQVQKRQVWLGMLIILKIIVLRWVRVFARIVSIVKSKSEEYFYEW